jgi:hypothetical protein
LNDTAFAVISLAEPSAKPHGLYSFEFVEVLVKAFYFARQSRQLIFVMSFERSLR